MFTGGRGNWGPSSWGDSPRGRANWGEPKGGGAGRKGRSRTPRGQRGWYDKQDEGVGNGAEESWEDAHDATQPTAAAWMSNQDRKTMTNMGWREQPAQDGDEVATAAGICVFLCPPDGTAGPPRIIVTQQCKNGREQYMEIPKCRLPQSALVGAKDQMQNAALEGAKVAAAKELGLCVNGDTLDIYDANLTTGKNTSAAGFGR